MALLKELLKSDEIKDIQDRCYKIDTNVLEKDFIHLTIQDLSDIAFALLGTEYKLSNFPKGSLSANAIQILTNRAIERKIELF